MAGDGLKRVRRGQRRRMSANTWNRMLAMLQAYEAKGPTNAPGSGDALRPGQMYARNDSGSDFDSNEIAGVLSVLVDPADSTTTEAEFQWYPTITVTTPNVPDKAGGPTQGEQDHRATFVVTAEPIADGEVGRVWVSGIVACQVTCTSNYEYRSAIPTDGVRTQLTCSDVGTVPLYWREGGTGSQWGLVGLPASVPVMEGLTLAEGSDVSGLPLWRETWAVLPVVMDRSGFPATGQESNLAGGVRTNADTITFGAGFASRTVFPVITDYAGNVYPLASDMRTCNHFTDAYGSNSPASETNSGPVFFTNQQPANWASIDAWGKPDFGQAFKGRMWFDTSQSPGFWRPVVPLACADVDAVLGLTAALLSFQIEDAADITYAQQVGASVVAAAIADFGVNGLLSPNLAVWTPPAVPVRNYVMPCDGETPSWSQSDDVPRCS